MKEFKFTNKAQLRCTKSNSDECLVTFT